MHYSLYIWPQWGLLLDRHLQKKPNVFGIIFLFLLYNTEKISNELTYTFNSKPRCYSGLKQLSNVYSSLYYNHNRAKYIKNMSPFN